MSYKIPKVLSCVSSMITTILVAVFLAKDYSNISIDNLSSDEKIFTGVLIFSEIILGLTMIYLTFACIWSGIVLCCNDEDKTTFQFSFYKVLFLLGCIASNFYLFYVLVTNRIMIDNLITASGWLLVSNMFFICIVGIINKIYQIRHKKKEYQEF